jgi:hypothetical protein
MRDSLELLRKHFKDFLYYRSMRHIKIVDPGMDEVWGDSAIHPQPLVYCRIAAAIIRIADSMEQEASNKRRQSDSIDGAGRSGKTTCVATVTLTPDRIGGIRTAQEAPAGKTAEAAATQDASGGGVAAAEGEITPTKPAAALSY